MYLIMLVPVSWSGFAQKTDKVFLKNGDDITGEIKRLNYAKLSFDMTGPGVIDIKWEEIVEIVSDKTFQFTLRSGEVILTTLESLFSNKPSLTLDDIVEIVQIKDKFFQRLEGDITLGFNYNKSNSSANFNFSNTITFRRPKTEVNTKFNSVLSKNKNDTILSKNQDASLNYYRDLKNSFILFSNLGWEQNTALGLANRFLYKGGFGKIFVNNNHQRLISGVGLSYNVEQSTTSADYNSNLESLITIQFKQFRYSTPKVSIDANFTILPGLSDWGRLRMDLQLNMKYEIFKDFNVGLSFYDLYDNRPPEGAVSKNDFGVNTTLGYVFGK
jgi:hypothetical protein